MVRRRCWLKALKIGGIVTPLPHSALHGHGKISATLPIGTTGCLPFASGLDTSTERSLWRDRALVELNRANHGFDGN